MEGEAAHRALAISRVAGCRALLFHASAAEVVRKLASVKETGHPAFGEACLHHLVLDESLLEDPSVGPAFELSPPLRDESHRAALWAGLADGTLDVVSTDHGPRRLARDPSGMLVPPSRDEWDRGAARPSGRVRRPGRPDPGEVGRGGLLQARRGLRPPVEGEAAFPAATRASSCSTPSSTLSHSRLHSHIDHSTCEGTTVRGYPVVTVCRGEVVVEDGRLRVEPGFGRLAVRGFSV